MRRGDDHALQLAAAIAAIEQRAASRRLAVMPRNQQGDARPVERGRVDRAAEFAGIERGRHRIRLSQQGRDRLLMRRFDRDADHRPLNTGLRFSLNDAMPSRRSSVPTSWL